MFSLGMRNFFVDESSFMGGFGSYLKFLTVVSTIFGGVLYYVPVSRSYFRKGCHILIDLVALSLKSVLNSFEAESENVNQARVTFPNALRHREGGRGSREERRQRRQENRMKGRGKNEEERSQELSTVQLYPGRGLELQKYLKGSRGRLGESEIYMLKEPRNGNSADVKWSKSTIRRDDDTRYSDNDDTMTLTGRNDEINQLKKRKSRRTRRDDTEVQKLEEKLRKLRRRIRSIAEVPDENFKQQKETEALEIIEELLKNSEYKLEIKQIKKNLVKNRPDDVKRADDVISQRTTRSERKSRSSSRQGSPGVVDLPKAGGEDDVARAPLLNDRVTPVMKNALHWIFGGCPGSH